MAAEPRKPSYRKLIIILGENHSGKQTYGECLQPGSWCDPTFDGAYYKTVEVQDTVFHLEFFPQGPSEYSALVHQSMKSTDATVLMYSIISRDTFRYLETQSWPLVERYKTERKIVHQASMLIGTKSDLESRREVSREEGEAFAQRLGIPFFEVTAKDEAGLAETATRLASDVKVAMEKQAIIDVERKKVEKEQTLERLADQDRVLYRSKLRKIVHGMKQRWRKSDAQQ